MTHFILTQQHTNIYLILTMLFLSMAKVSRLGVILLSATVLLSTSRSGHTSPPPAAPISPDPDEGVPENCLLSHWAWLMPPRVGEVGESLLILSSLRSQATARVSGNSNVYLNICVTGKMSHRGGVSKTRKNCLVWTTQVQPFTRLPRSFKIGTAKLPELNIQHSYISLILTKFSHK